MIGRPGDNVSTVNIFSVPQNVSIVNIEEWMSDRYHHGDLRAALLDTAAAMIAENGVENLTIRGLAQRIGVSHTASYRHFATKNALLAAVAEDGFNRLVARLRAIREAQPADPLLALSRMFTAYVEFAVENPTHYRLMYGEEVFNRQEYPELTAVSRQVFSEVYLVVTQGQQAHLIKPTPPIRIACTCWAMAHGVSLLILNGILPLTESVEVTAQSVFVTLAEGFQQEKP